MTVRIRDIGLLPETRQAPAVYRTSVVVNARPYYIDTEPSLTGTERRALIEAEVEKIKARQARA